MKDVSPRYRPKRRSNAYCRSCARVSRKAVHTLSANAWSSSRCRAPRNQTTRSVLIGQLPPEPVAGDRGAMVEGAVADRADRVLSQIVLSHRIQPVEQHAGGIDLQWLPRNHTLAKRPGQGVGIVPITLDAHVDTVPVEPVVPGRWVERRAGHGSHQQQAQHGAGAAAWRRISWIMG